jgi:hypothetical protein
MSAVTGKKEYYSQEISRGENRSTRYVVVRPILD